MPRSVWKISAPARSASANDAAPTGMTMNSWKSTLLSACAPPLRMFIIGTGSTVPRGARGRPAEVLVERHVRRGRGRLGERHRDAEQGIGAEAPLVLGAIEIDHRLVDRALIGVVAGERLRDFAVHMADRFRDALAEIPLLVPVAELERLALPGRRARGHRGAADAPPSSVTSTSTVGLPRESMISRPWTL